ncbi:DCL family protein [Pseudomonas putida]|uniref:DCL family protein n=1 Tax=Pseudomonas putida TaxID=303 RepID=UPI002022C6CE|nr:DCL family protein [Pseudomonas putida]MCL8308306.1 DCL family protein [Pseudomonas putida]
MGPFEYASKQALLDRLKHFIRTGDVGRIIHPVAAQKLHLLLALHPDAERKIGVGVDHFCLERNPLAGRGLRLVRTDGTTDSFSYKRCITGVTQSHHGKVCEALRFAVRPQMDSFRAGLQWPINCAITGNEIVHPNDLHIDHKIPFWRLLDEFCRACQVDLRNLEVIGNGMTLALADREVLQAFVDFHRQHAKLQPTSRQANVLKGGRLQS